MQTSSNLKDTSNAHEVYDLSALAHGHARSLHCLHSSSELSATALWCHGQRHKLGTVLQVPVRQPDLPHSLLSDVRHLQQGFDGRRLECTPQLSATAQMWRGHQCKVCTQQSVPAGPLDLPPSLLGNINHSSRALMGANFHPVETATASWWHGHQCWNSHNAVSAGGAA